jgi:hypothetical protein
MRAWNKDVQIVEMRHDEPLNLIRFDQPGNTLMTMTAGGTALLFDCREILQAETLSELTMISRVHVPRSLAAAFSWRSRKLATATKNELRIWNLAI